MTTTNDKPVTVTAQNFEAEVVNAGVPVVVDFWAPWCAPCRAIGPMLEDLAGVYAGRVKVAKVNVDEEPALAGAFQVRSIPTLAVLKGNEVVDVQIGAGGRAHLEGLFQRAEAGDQRKAG